MRKEKLEELKTYIEELKTVKILEKRELKNTTQNPFLTIQNQAYLLANSNIIEREQLLKNKQEGSTAIVLPITEEGNTLLVVQPRPNTKSTVGIEFPAGYIEPGELPIFAAERELQEETGYIPKKIQYLTSYYQDQGCSAAFNYSYLATGCQKKTNQHLDPTEYIRYFECTYQEVLELEKLGYINDANSIISLAYAKPYLHQKKLERRNYYV